MCCCELKASFWHTWCRTMGATDRPPLCQSGGIQHRRLPGRRRRRRGQRVVRHRCTDLSLQSKARVWSSVNEHLMLRSKLGAPDMQPSPKPLFSSNSDPSTTMTGLPTRTPAKNPPRICRASDERAIERALFDRRERWLSTLQQVLIQSLILCST